jgi:hypothetical protein
MATLRQIALGWNPDNEPTELEFNATSDWFTMSGHQPNVTPFELARLNELIRRFKVAHPEIWPGCQ